MEKMNLKSSVLAAVFILMGLSVFLFIQHEIHMIRKEQNNKHGDKLLRVRVGQDGSNKLAALSGFRDKSFKLPSPNSGVKAIDESRNNEKQSQQLEAVDVTNLISVTEAESEPEVSASTAAAGYREVQSATVQPSHAAQPIVSTVNTPVMNTSISVLEEQKGILMCNGKQVDSEIIYWKIVPGDITYESPITPHHGIHHDRYLTFEYDQGGWNNVRMGMECLIVVAHAMGRTLVIPPQQHLYLLGKTHKDEGDKKAHDEMGFEDFFDIGLLESHKGFHVIEMQEFLEKEGVTGGLHGQLPPGNTSNAWGPQLWSYLDKVCVHVFLGVTVVVCFALVNDVELCCKIALYMVTFRSFLFYCRWQMVILNGKGISW